MTGRARDSYRGTCIGRSVSARSTLQPYVNEFAGRNNIGDKDTVNQMQSVVAGMVGKRERANSSGLG